MKTRNGDFSMKHPVVGELRSHQDLIGPALISAVYRDGAIAFSPQL